MPIDTRHFVPLGAVSHVERSVRGLLLQAGDERLRVDVLRPDLLRLKISRAGLFDEQPSVAAAGFAEPAPVDFELEESAQVLVLRTAALTLSVTRASAALDAWRRDGSTIFESYRQGELAQGYLHLNDAFAVRRRARRHDSIFGLGEKTGAFDRRGRRYTLWNTDVLAPNVLASNRLYDSDPSVSPRSTEFDPYYASIPFFYHADTTRAGCPMAGFFVDNPYKAEFDFSDADSYGYRFFGGQYTEYVFAGPAMPSILEAYTAVTGRMPVPPLWSLGHQQCRWHAYTESSLLELARQYRGRSIPCDALWLDIDHMHDYRVFTWNPLAFPDPKRLFDRLAELGLRAVAIVDPGVKHEPGYAVFDEGRAAGLFCKTESGELYLGQVWPGPSAFPDFSKAEARAFWGELNARHIALGLSGIWNDMNEPATGEIEPFTMRFDRDGQNHAHERFHNQYATLMAEATWEGLTRQDPERRTFILSRAGSPGIQRYAAQWLGDNCSRWEHLAMSLPMAAGLGVSGQPFVGADIPGFLEKPSGELMVRWMQYGALTPFCRCHNCAGEDDQYPWSFGPGVERECRAALERRYRLLPYLYSAFVQASETGAPVQRPLAYDFQADRDARDANDQYLLGEALLVAPVLAAGQSARHVYLPRGTWVDWYDGRKYSGETRITRPAAIDTIPLFARGGYVVPCYERAPPSTHGHYPELLELLVFVPDEDGETRSFLHEDDGLTHARRRGACLCTEFSLSRQGSQVRLQARVQGQGYPEHRRKHLRLTFHNAPSDRARSAGHMHTLRHGRLEIENSGAPFEIEFT